MTYRLGIDLGTTFTAAAVLHEGADPAGVRLGERGAAAPTVMFLAEDGSVLFGDAAEGRAPDAPERIARHFKRRVGDEVPLVLGGTSTDQVTAYAHDLCAAMIAWVLATVTTQEGAAPDAIAVTHPASWNRRKLDLLLTALQAHDLPPVTLITEPEAAAAGYAHTSPIAHPATLAVYDLGGGTCDVALLDTTADGRFTCRGRPAGLEGLGGIDFDDAIMSHVLAAADAATWAGIDADQVDPKILRALAQLRTASVAAKETLSIETATCVRVRVAGTLITVPLERSDFDGLIDAMVDRSVEFFHAVMAGAGLGPDDLSSVLLTGGSVQVPLVTDMLAEDLPARVQILRSVDPKAMVAVGAVLSLRWARGAATVPAARAGAENSGSPSGPLPHARDGAAADRAVPVCVAAAGPAPGPVRAARARPRRPRPLARTVGPFVLDEAGEHDPFRARPARGGRRRSVLARVGVFGVLAATVAGAVTYWDQAQAPGHGPTQVSRTADTVTGTVRAAYKPAKTRAPDRVVPTTTQAAAIR